MLPTLQEAIQAIKAGDKETGRQMLADILQADLENEQAWLWLSGVIDSDEEKRKYLNQVLEINPDNKAAKRGLALLDKNAVDQPEPDVPQQFESPPESARPLLSRITAQQKSQSESDAMLAEEPDLASESPELSLPPAEPSPISQPEPVIPPPIELEEEPEPSQSMRPEAESSPSEPEVMSEGQADRAEPVVPSPEPDEEPDYEFPPELDELGETPAAPSQAHERDSKTLRLAGGLVAVLLICAACVVAGLVFQPAWEELSPTLIAAIGTDTPTPTITPTPSNTPAPNSSPTKNPSPTPPPTLTATATGTRVVADTPTVTPFPTKTSTPDPSRQSGQVVGVVSSTIIDVMIDGVEFRVKYLLIDTPAVNDPDRGTELFGPEAVEINRSLVEGQIISLEKDVSDTDEFGRLLRYVYVGDLLINEELIRQGVAWVAPVPPDLKYQARFQEVQAAAQIDGLGVWSLVSSAEPTPPPPPQVIIVAVNHNEEHVDIQNVGNNPQDLTGWKLLSQRDGQACTLEGVVIQPGETLRIWALLADAGRGGYNCGFTQNIWSNIEPDPAVLYTPDGREVSRLD